MVLLNFEPKLQGTVVLQQCVSKSLGMLMLKICMRDWTMLMESLWREEMMSLNTMLPPANASPMELAIEMSIFMISARMGMILAPGTLR
jgi:hypothetical protein